MTATDARGEILAHAGVHQALDGAGQFVDLTVEQCEQPAADEAQPFANAESIALMARYAVGRLGKYLIDPTSLCAREHGMQTWALFGTNAGSAADGVIGKHVHDQPSLAIGAGAQQRDLVLDRPGVL